jgi:hypothetical protein
VPKGWLVSGLTQRAGMSSAPIVWRPGRRLTSPLGRLKEGDQATPIGLRDSIPPEYAAYSRPEPRVAACLLDESVTELGTVMNCNVLKGSSRDRSDCVVIGRPRNKGEDDLPDCVGRPPLPKEMRHRTASRPDGCLTGPRDGPLGTLNRGSSSS